METMRALVATAVGEPADVLRLETRPIPTASPGQVRVRAQAAPEGDQCADRPGETGQDRTEHERCE
jgi:hypothetical protein